MANQIHTQATELVVLSPEIWSARLRELNRASLPFLDSVDLGWQGDGAGIGDIVNVNQIPDFSQANTLAEGAAGDAEAVTATQTQITINQRPYKDFIVTKKAQLQSLDFMDQLRENAVYSIQKKIQALIIAQISPSASAPDHQIAFDSGTTLALADILEAKELLMEANCPQDDRLCMVLGSEQWNDLYNITGFTSRDFVPAGSPLTSGEFATPLAGFKPKYTSVAGDVAYLFNSSFLALVIQQQMNIEVVSMGADGIRGMRVNADVLLGVSQLDDERVVTIS